MQSFRCNINIGSEVFAPFVNQSHGQIKRSEHGPGSPHPLSQVGNIDPASTATCSSPSLVSSNHSLYNSAGISFIMDDRSKPSSGPGASNAHIPPPTDPYVTYQTPYPRRPSDDAQNPFIEFRRLADAAFSSFFSGLPRLLGTEQFKEANIRESDQAFIDALNEQAKEFEGKIAEMVRTRAEEAEGFRKKLEQDWEERRRENERRMEEESQRWEMMRRGLERCPGLRPEETGVRHQPESELDLYNGLKAYEAAAYKTKPPSQSTEIAKCPWKDEEIDKRCPWNEKDDANRSWLSGLGYDGLRRAKNIPLYVATPRDNECSPRSNAEWQEYRDDNMDPFSHDDHLVPWLKLSPYSPLSLIQSWNSKHDQSGLVPDLSEFPWDEAFEDLMSVHKTGKLPSLIRRLVYWGGPDQWMTEMALRGSLGSNWSEGHMVSALIEAVQGKQWREFEGFQERCRQLAGKAFEPNAAYGPTSERDIAEAEDVENSSEDWDGLSDDSLEPRIRQAYEDLAHSLMTDVHTPDCEYGARGMKWPTPEEVINALSESFYRSEDGQHTDGSSSDTETVSASRRDNMRSSFSTEASSWSSADGKGPESIISTMTTTTSITLPDGSVETKRILKKRFADGREENSESTEMSPAVPNTETDTGMKAIKGRGEESKGGWFWN